MSKLIPMQAFFLGGGVFIAASYILHCGFGMGPWGCQRSDKRNLANELGI